MKKWIYLILLLLSLNASAQKILLEEDPAVDTTDTDFGPNQRNFVHFYYGYGMFFGKENKGAEIHNGNSYYLTAGLRYKHKITEFYSLGADLAYTNATYRLKQNSAKIVPDTLQHKKERLSWMYFNASVYNRFNFKKRGDILGSYIDIGAEAGYSFSFVHFYYDRADDGRAIKTRVRGLDYFQPFYYSAFARLGFDRLSLSCSYRLSNLFKSKSNYPDLPPLCISLQLAIY
jgi:hypothetical protein